MTASRRRKIRRQARKIRRIGVLGALTGLYLRSWSGATAAEDIAVVAGRFGVPVESTPRIHCDRTRELLRRSGAELGITLGTPLIRPSVFGIPRHGMINVHGDVLPRFRGGASVLWPIYEGVSEAGFTIHQIDRGIDTGGILYVERFPINFRRTLKETFLFNVAEIQRRVPGALARVVAGYADYPPQRQRAGEGRTYTTPTLRQFLRMLRRHRQLRRAAAAGPTSRQDSV